MSRILFFLLLALLGWIFFFKKKPSGDDAQARTSAPPVERMVKCAHCGLLLPEGEAVVDGDRHFCSAEHRDDYAQRG